MNSNIIIGGIAIVAFLGVTYAVTSQKDGGKVAATEYTADEVVNKEEAMVEKEVATAVAGSENPDEVMMKKGDVTDDAMMNKEGIYEVYAPERLAMANDGDVVLFFKASWCPSCRAVDADIKASLGDIPEGVTILEVDYDTATELKKKYGVTSQHTFVQVDAQGNELSQWSGSATLESILGKLK